MQRHLPRAATAQKHCWTSLSLTRTLASTLSPGVLASQVARDQAGDAARHGVESRRAAAAAPAALQGSAGHLVCNSPRTFYCHSAYVCNKSMLTFNMTRHLASSMSIGLRLHADKDLGQAAAVTSAASQSTCFKQNIGSSRLQGPMLPRHLPAAVFQRLLCPPSALPSIRS